MNLKEDGKDYMTRREKDMVDLINLQLSIFSDKRLVPTPEKIPTLMNKINSISGLAFMPSIINQPFIDLKDQQMKSIPNLTFVTADQYFQIISTQGRIDVSFKVPPNGNLDYDRHLSIAEKLLSTIMLEDGIRANRLALFFGLLGTQSADRLRPFINKFSLPLNFYNDKELAQWSSMCNSRLSVELHERTETVNILTTLSNAKNSVTQEDGVFCNADINTVPEQLAFRFSSDSIAAFITAVKPFADAIKSDFEGSESADV